MQDKRQNLLFRWLIHSQIAPLRGAEAGIRLSAARTDLGGNAGSHGAGDGVAGTGGAVACLLCYHLLQSVLLLYLKEVRLLPLLLTDAKGKRGHRWLDLLHHKFLNTIQSQSSPIQK